MADEDTALSREPRANPDLFGHDAAEAALRRAFDSGRLPHAWLITGPRGVGKATLAFRFARFVLAGLPSPKRSSGFAQAGGAAERDLLGGNEAGLALAPDHPIFRRVASGGHADLLTIERSVDPKTGRLRSEVVVEDARRLGDFMALTPFEGGWRVAVVDAADEMNRSAVNAVLKVVEEPPRQSLVLLVCHQPGRVSLTLRSRCRTLALSPLPDGQVAELLARWLPSLGADEALRLARLAEGCPGRALALAERGGLELYAELVALIASAPGIEVRRLHGFADRLARRGADDAFATAMALLAGWLARLVAAGARGTVPEPLVAGEGEAAARLLAVRGLDQWVELWEKVVDLAARTQRVNLDQKRVVLSLFAALERAARA